MNKPFEFNQGQPMTTEHAGVTVQKVGVHLGAEVSGVDLRRTLSNQQFTVVSDALVEHELIIFRNQDITSRKSYGIRPALRRTHRASLCPERGRERA